MQHGPRARDAYAARLYAIAPGSFLIHGIPIPVRIEYEGTISTERRVARQLGRLGFSVRNDAPLVLSIAETGTQIAYAVVDRETGSELRTGNVGFSPDVFAEAIEGIARNITRVPGMGAIQSESASLPHDHVAAVGEPRAESDR
jgi:hypothetical protein